MCTINIHTHYTYIQLCILYIHIHITHIYTICILDNIQIYIHIYCTYIWILLSRYLYTYNIFICVLDVTYITFICVLYTTYIFMSINIYWNINVCLYFVRFTFLFSPCKTDTTFIRKVSSYGLHCRVGQDYLLLLNWVVSSTLSQWPRSLVMLVPFVTLVRSLGSPHPPTTTPSSPVTRLCPFLVNDLSNPGLTFLRPYSVIA